MLVAGLFGGGGAGRLYAALPLVAALSVAEMLSGKMDGESWDFVPYAAMGWWAMLWLVVLIAESVMWLTTRAPQQRGFEPIVGPPPDQAA
jgi:hypothetical protein